MKTSGTIKTETRAIGALIPFARNSRTHSDEQVAQIAASIREFGWTNPILVDGVNGIIAGHGRLMAARKLGMEQVPVIVLDHLTDAQKRALVIADNKLALNAGWDMELLSSEIEGLGEDGFDLSLLGFNEDELAALLVDKTEGLTDPDDIPEVPADPVSVLGDVWVMGKHRIVCGDSTDAEVFAKLLDGKQVSITFTSPPYNANAKFGSLHKSNMGPLYADNADNMESSEYISFARDVLALCIANTSKHVFWNVNYNTNSRFEYIAQIIEFLPLLIEQVCWKKDRVIPYQAGLRRFWEPIYIFKTNPNSGNVGDDSICQDNFVEFAVNGEQKVADHRACFPIALVEWAINLDTKAGDAVLDPFSGSGSTILACERTGRSARAIELSPAYVDVAVKRWQDFTGQQAIHEATGKTFADMADNLPTQPDTAREQVEEVS